MSGLTLYYDPLSQPSRAVWIFLKVNGIPFEEKIVSIMAGEHKADDYKKIHPFQLVPAISHNGFILTESVAIMKYLADKFSPKITEHWHPRDPYQRAKVDEFLAWQHLNLRKDSVFLFWAVVITPMMSGKPADPKKVDRLRTQLQKTLDNIENVFLKDHLYLASNEISIADIHAICEIMQNTVAGFEPTIGRPKLKAWMERVKEKLEPYFGQSHQALLSMGQSLPNAKL